MAQSTSHQKSDDLFFTLSFMVVMALMIGLFLGYLWMHNTVTTTIKENVALQQFEQKLTNKNKELRSEISQLSRGDRITTIAREKLGMVSPEPESLVVFVPNNLIANSEQPNQE